MNHDQEAMAGVPFQAGGHWTREELADKLNSMRLTSNTFYTLAQLIQVHPFLEFTGLMKEYIKCCERAFEDGIDFTECSTHSGRPLPIPDHSLAYMAEKLQCIFEGHDSLTQLFDYRPLRLRLEKLGEVLERAEVVEVKPGQSRAELTLAFLEAAWAEEIREEGAA